MAGEKGPSFGMIGHPLGIFWVFGSLLGVSILTSPGVIGGVRLGSGSASLGAVRRSFRVGSFPASLGFWWVLWLPGFVLPWVVHLSIVGSMPVPRGSTGTVIVTVTVSVTRSVSVTVSVTVTVRG